MQEEVENRAVNLAISTTKLGFRTIVNGIRKYLEHRGRVRAAKKSRGYQGKQTVKQLIGQNQGVSNIDIAKTELKGFEKIARKYGVDFAVVKEKGAEAPRYHIFFKARDVDAITAMYKELCARTLNKSKRPSVLDKLKKFKEIAASHVSRVKTRSRERKQER